MNLTTHTNSAKSDALISIPDSECDVTLVKGNKLDSRRIQFEIAMLSLDTEASNAAANNAKTLALRTPSKKFTLAIAQSGNSKNNSAPRSLALTAGLIAHGFVPDDWLCGMLTFDSANSESSYLTIFDCNGIYGRTKLESYDLSQMQKQIDRSLASMLPSAKNLEALYLDSPETSSNAQLQSQLSDALDILVEPLPSDREDLTNAGLRWLASEVS